VGSAWEKERIAESGPKVYVEQDGSEPVRCDVREVIFAGCECLLWSVVGVKAALRGEQSQRRERAAFLLLQLAWEEV